MGWLAELKKKSKNYTKHPLDSGLQTVAAGVLLPILALTRFPIVTAYGPMEISAAASLSGGTPRPSWTDRVYASEYDPYMLVILPCVLMAFAVAVRAWRKTWCYWTLTVLSALYCVSYVANFALAVVSGDAGALEDAQRLAALDIAAPAAQSASWGYVSLAFVAAGSTAVLVGAAMMHKKRKELAA